MPAFAALPCLRPACDSLMACPAQNMQAAAVAGLQPGDEVGDWFGTLELAGWLHPFCKHVLAVDPWRSIGLPQAASANQPANLTPWQVRMRLVYDGRGRGPRIEYLGRSGARAGRADGAAAGAAGPSKVEGPAAEPPPQVGAAAISCCCCCRCTALGALVRLGVPLSLRLAAILWHFLT